MRKKTGKERVNNWVRASNGQKLAGLFLTFSLFCGSVQIHKGTKTGGKSLPITFKRLFYGPFLTASNTQKS